MTALAACSRSAAPAPPDDRTAPAPPAALPAAAARSSGAEMWGARYFPDVVLTTQRGERVRFFDDLIRDKVVAINFIYTRCADSCPMETARMVEVQRLLGDRLGRDVFFYSISIDPVHDTPDVLAAYAQTWHTGPGWTFLTGAEADITLLREKLGVYDPDRRKRDHNLSLIIGNQRTGQWMKRSPYENPYLLADQLGRWLHNWNRPGATDRDYAHAPELRNLSTGEELFRARCAACHTVGGGDLADLDNRRVGPDLMNVSRRRDRDWLVRWMMQPDQLIAAGDPIARSLVAQYRDVTMPNLRLSSADADALLRYLDDESDGVAARASHPAPAAARPAAPHARVVISGALAPALRAALSTYDDLRRRLAADDLAGAREAAARLPDRIGPEPAASTSSASAALDLTGSAHAVARATDLDAARAGFGALSRQLVSVLADNPRLQQGWWLFQCPSAPTYQKWLQSDATLTNPYWGKRMLTCGSVAARWSI